MPSLNSQTSRQTGPQTAATRRFVAASTPGAPPLPIATSRPQRAGERGSRRAHPHPDLTGLNRDAASVIESMAAHALISLRHAIDATRDVVRKARPDCRWHAERQDELTTLEAQRDEIERYQLAARRIRMMSLSQAERDRLTVAREANPDIRGSEIEALLFATSIDPLDHAAIALEAAGDRFTLACQNSHDEAAFAQAEDALDESRRAYRRLLAERAGQDSTAIERRLMI